MSRLEDVRKSRGVTKTAIAEHLGITRQTYASYEAEPERLSIEQAQAIAGFLHCGLDVFFGREVNAPNIGQ